MVPKRRRHLTPVKGRTVMAETKCAYEVLFSKKAQDLDKKGNHPLSHGSDGACPNCGHFGQDDLK